MLTPEQTQDLVAHFGGLRAAARAIGVHETTVLYWRDPEHKRRLERARYRRNPAPRRARQRERYDALSGYEYNQLLLRQRRAKALARRRRREEV